MFLQEFGNCYIIQNKWLLPHLLSEKCKFLVIFEIVEAEAKGQKEGILVLVFRDYSI